MVDDMTKFVKGNEAVVIGALYAGADVYFGYPITPASEIAHAAADWFPALGREFLQAECETGSINMLYGAAAAGRLAMTATSWMALSCFAGTPRNVVPPATRVSALTR